VRSGTGSGGYVHEFRNPEQHAALLEVLLNLQGRVALSGYANPQYDQTLTGWHRAEFRARSGAMGPSQKTEVLWMNFKPEGHLL
jgi:site-specific DNA-adenine methylase